MKYSIAKIHQEFIPKYDRWNGKILPRMKSWFAHIIEIPLLWLKGNKSYYKHGEMLGTCRQHSYTEFGDLLWLTAEIFWMITKVELPVVPQETFKRVWDKMSENRQNQDGD